MWLHRLFRWLETVIELTGRIFNSVCSGVLFLMMLLTTADVSLRYIFKSPILGTVDLTEFMMAVIVFMSLGYVALRKGHITIDLVTSHFSTGVREIMDCITTSLSLGFFSLITWQSFVHAIDKLSSNSTSPILLIPVYPFILVAVVGSAFLCLVLLSNLFVSLAKVFSSYRFGWLWLLPIFASFTLVYTVPFWWAYLPFKFTPVILGLIGFVAVFLLIFLGMPIGFAIGLCGFLGMSILKDTGVGLSLIGINPYATSATHELSVLPLFVLMGAYCFSSGISRDLYDTAYIWTGNLPGGLAVATVGACACFAAVSGSSLASAATMGTIALPEMKKHQYDAALACGSVAAGGTLAILIPPSIILVIYGILTAQSIGKLFIAGFLPGFLLVALYVLTIYFRCKLNPSLGPPGQKTSFKEKILSLSNTGPVLVLFLLCMGGIYLGVFTPTEGAGIGAFGAFLFTFLRKKLSWTNFADSLTEASKVTGMAFLILIGAALFGYFLAVSRLPFETASLIGGLALNRYVVFIVIVFLYLILGCIMDTMAMIVLTVPIFFPVVLVLGFDPIWFGIIMVILVETAMVTPPIGINVFIIKGIAKDVPMYTIFRGILPFVISNVILIVLLTLFPQIALFLPNMMK